jgi:dUTP pyrophosphatase
MIDEKGIERGEDWYNLTCPICGKKFHLKPYRIKKYKNHYCSRECHKEAKKEYMSGEKNHQFGIKGKDNASWKSDRKLTHYGYLAIRTPNHPFAPKDGFVLEHRLIAEKYLLTEENSIEIDGKKYLRQEYDVHHIDFDRRNNKIENLKVMTKSEHKSLHCKLNPNKTNKKGQFMEKEPSIIKVKRTTMTAILPERKSIGAAGYDLYVDSEKEIVIPPFSTVMVSSGVAFEIPNNYFGAIYARSGLSTKEGIRPATCVSIIDSDYRGTVGLPLHNDTAEEKKIKPYERVAQIVFQKALVVELELVDKLEPTERGENGCGSSGR